MVAFAKEGDRRRGLRGDGEFGQNSEGSLELGHPWRVG